MGVCHVDVHVLEQVVGHEVVVALGIVVREPAILVQVIGADLREVYLAATVFLDEEAVGADGRGARGEAQDAPGVKDELGSADISRTAAHLIVVCDANDSHASSVDAHVVRRRAGPRPWTRTL